MLGRVCNQVQREVFQSKKIFEEIERCRRDHSQTSSRGSAGILRRREVVLRN